jgi:uncharacterized protein YjiS (DUF1127 family)
MIEPPLSRPIRSKGHLAMWILTLLDTLNRYRRFRASMHQLNTLNDATLRDIGLDRTEITGKAWEAAWKN